MPDPNRPSHGRERLRRRITKLASELLKETAEPANDSLKTRWLIFYGFWNRRLTRIAGKAKAPRGRIEDLVQNVARKVLLRWDEFRRSDGARQMLSLSYKIMHDEAVDLIRSLERNRHASLDGVPSEPIDPKASNPADIAERKESCERMASNLERLREKYPRYAWVLRERFLKGRPIKCLAMEKGMNEHAMRCIITRALRRMQRLMAEGNAGGEDAF